MSYRQSLVGAVLLFLAALGCAHVPEAHHPHWTYEGAEGPEAWGSLAPEFGACSAGHAQSPIDLKAAAAKPLPPLGIDWKPAPLELINNGHTLQQTAGAGSSLTVGDRTYALAQLHFHHQSEHALVGKRFPLEVHLVHKGPNGELAVVGVFFEAGAENPALGAILAAAPHEKGGTAHGAAMIDPAAFFPADRGYFAYGGSLTTPPCTEGVRWQVLRAPVQASPAQLEAFAALFENNARPLMPLGARELTVDARP